MQTLHLQLRTTHSCSYVVHQFSWSRLLPLSVCQWNYVGVDLQHLTSHLANTNVLSKCTCFGGGGSISLEQRHPVGTSTLVDDKLLLMIL